MKEIIKVYFYVSYIKHSLGLAFLTNAPMGFPCHCMEEALELPSSLTAALFSMASFSPVSHVWTFRLFLEFGYCKY